MMIVNYDCKEQQKYVIKRFSLEKGLQDLEMPNTGQIISLENVMGAVLWMMVPTDRVEDTRVRRFLTVATGSEIVVEPGGILHFIGTLPEQQGVPIWHVFEIFSPLPDSNKGAPLYMPKEFQNYTIKF